MSETDPPVGNSSLEKVGHSPTENGEILDVRSSLLPGPSPGSGRSSPENKTSEAARKKARKERRVEEELKKAGFGVFHVILVLVTGLATAADSVEIFGVSFVLPIADDDLDLSTAHKGYLDASIFIGLYGCITLRRAHFMLASSPGSHGSCELRLANVQSFSAHLEHCRQKEKQQSLLQIIHANRPLIARDCPSIWY